MSKAVTIAALAAVVTTLTVPLLPRAAVAQSAIIYPWCYEPTDSVESCAFTSYAQCRLGNKLCARNGMYYLRDSSVYAAAPYGNSSVYASARFANSSPDAAAPSWSNSVTYTYVPATDDTPQPRRRR